MRSTPVATIGSLALCLACSVAWAGKPASAGYPLRVLIFSFNQRSHVYQNANGSVSLAEGEGHANLFDHSQPVAFDFSYSACQPIMAHKGFETYPARWKKPDSVLEILVPVFGLPADLDACDLKVRIKEGMAYYEQGYVVYEEPAVTYKAWMVAHKFDPEHGLNQPVDPAP